MTDVADSAPSIQDQYFADLTCFGCGPKNAKGLKLRSFAVDDGSVRASFRPWPEHDNGLGFLNGGIIATVLDCHSAAGMIVQAAQDGLVLDGTLPYVTAGIDLRYLRPSPLHDPVELIARVASADESEIVVGVELWWQDKIRANASATWKRWRPRTTTGSPTAH